MNKLVFLAIVVAVSNGAQSLEVGFSEEEEGNKIISPKVLTQNEKNTNPFRGIRRYWKENTPFSEENNSSEGEVRARGEKVALRKKPKESSEEDVILKKVPPVFKKPYIDTEEEEFLATTTRKTIRKLFRHKIVKPLYRLPVYHDNDYDEDPPIAIISERTTAMPLLPLLREKINADPAGRHRHRKKARRIIYIDSGESIEIIRKSHNKRRLPQDYEDIYDEYYEDTTTHSPEEAKPMAVTNAYTGNAATTAIISAITTARTANTSINASDGLPGWNATTVSTKSI